MNRKLKHGAVSVAAVAIVLAIAILLNATLAVLDEVFDLSLDLSDSQLTAIDDVSRSVLAELEGPVEIIVNGSEEDFKTARYETAETEADADTGESAQSTAFSTRRYTYELVDSFRKNSDFITVTYIDQRYNPGYFKARGITLEDNVFMTVYSPQTQRYAFVYNDVFDSQELVGLERRIDAGLRSVTKEDIKTVAIATGHGETSYPYLAVLLQNNAYTVTTLDVAAAPSLADRTDILVIANPTVAFSAQDIGKLRDFLFNNGAYGKYLFVFGDADMPKNPLLEDFLETEWGLRLEERYVFDPANTTTTTGIGDPVMRLAYGASDLAQDVAAELADRGDLLSVTVGKAREVTLAFDEKDSVYTAKLLKTISANAFAKTSVDPADFPPTTRAEGDANGSLTVGALAYLQRSADTGDQYGITSSGVALFGSTALLDTYFLSNMAGNTSATADYLLNLFRYVSHDDSVVKITAQSLITGVLQFDSDGMATAVSTVCIALIPAICAVACAVVWIRRKNL